MSSTLRRPVSALRSVVSLGGAPFPRRAALLVGLSLSVACQQQGQVTEARSAAGQASYAERYPTTLATSSESVDRAERDTETAVADFPKYPDSLKKTDYALVKRVYELANEAGRSASYSAAADDAETVSRFYAEEKEGLSRQVAGSARYAAKDKGATDPQADAAASGASFGLEKALTKQLEEHLRSASDADRFLDDHEEELGKGNIETLRKQAAAISRASHLVYVAGPRERQRLTKLVDEGSAVRSTLEREIEENGKVEGDAAASAKRRKAAKARKDAAEAARTELDGALERAKSRLQDLEKRQKDLTTKYEKAFSDLLEAVEAKAQAEPTAKDERS